MKEVLFFHNTTIALFNLINFEMWTGFFPLMPR
jgi:hypothetical protein